MRPQIGALQLDKAVFIGDDVRDHERTGGQEIEIGEVAFLRNYEGQVRWKRADAARPTFQRASELFPGLCRLLSCLRATDRPGVQKQAWPLEHIAGILAGKLAVDDVAILV